MTKFMFLLAFLIFASVPAHADKWHVDQVIDSSWTVSAVSISSLTATLVDSTITAVAMPLRVYTAFQTLATSTAIYCSGNPNVTTTTGFEVPVAPVAPYVLPIAFGALNSTWGPQNRLKVYCISGPCATFPKLLFIQGY